jgi:hypothetical protein
VTAQHDFHLARVRGIMIHLSSWDADESACCTVCSILNSLNLAEKDFGYHDYKFHRVLEYVMSLSVPALVSLNTIYICIVVSACEEVSKS